MPKLLKLIAFLTTLLVVSTSFCSDADESKEIWQKLPAQLGKITIIGWSDFGNRSDGKIKITYKAEKKKKTAMIQAGSVFEGYSVGKRVIRPETFGKPSGPLAPVVIEDVPLRKTNSSLILRNAGGDKFLVIPPKPK